MLVCSVLSTLSSFLSDRTFAEAADRDRGNDLSKLFYVQVSVLRVVEQRHRLKHFELGRHSAHEGLCWILDSLNLSDEVEFDKDPFFVVGKDSAKVWVPIFETESAQVVTQLGQVLPQRALQVNLLGLKHEDWLEIAVLLAFCGDNKVGSDAINVCSFWG